MTIEEDTPICLPQDLKQSDCFHVFAFMDFIMKESNFKKYFFKEKMIKCINESISFQKVQNLFHSIGYSRQ